LSVIKRGIFFSQLTEGNFDITIKPLVDLWGINGEHPKVPSEDEIRSVLKEIGSQRVVINESQSTIQLPREEMGIDLGGIAKGYAADEIKRIFQQYQVVNALINLGGNVIVMGHNPTGARWRIGIQNPLAARGQYIGTIEMTDKTVVTSGSNEQFFIKNGVRYHHIINPRTGYSSENGLLSVTVVSECSMDADAVTTALFIQDIQESMHMLKSIHAEAVFIMQNKDIFVTEGLIDNFKRSPI
jgi:thiamine biosynthesis lipoprotein